MDRERIGITARRLLPGLVAAALVLAAGCGSKPEYYRGDVAGIQAGSRVALLPLVNLSKDEKAPEVVLNALLVELLATSRFNVVDPGLVEEVVQRERLRLTDRLPLDKLQALGAALAVDYVFVGSVNEFGMVRDAQEELPTVSIALRMVSCSTGNIVWAATHTKRGDDSESLFRLGRINTLEELTAVAAREMVPTILPENRESKPKTEGAGNAP